MHKAKVKSCKDEVKITLMQDTDAKIKQAMFLQFLWLSNIFFYQKINLSFFERK